MIIGLDVGTTASKAVVFGLSGGSRLAQREYPLLTPQPGWRVQDPEVVVGAALATLAEVSGPDVLGVALSTAMHGLIGLDAQLRPVTPLLTWADGRSAEQAASLRASGAAAVLYEISGVPNHPMTPLTKLMWFSSTAPDEAARVVHWVGLKDYLVWHLTGELVTELSSASGTGLMDRRRHRWSPTAVEIAGVSRASLPPILPTTHQFPLLPDVAAQVGLPAGTPVVLGAGDGPLGNAGTGALEAGAVGLSLGTSGAARMALAQPTLDPHGRLFCYALTDDMWVLGGAVSTGGSVVRWVRQMLGARSDEQLLDWASQAPAGSDGLVMLPYLMAERAPLWDPQLPGAYVGVRSHHDRRHLARAAVEGVAVQLGAVVDGLRRVGPVTGVKATGGALRSPLWREVLAGVLNAPVHVASGAEGTARGAAALGLCALGVSDDLAAALEILQPEVGDVTLPQDVDTYAQLQDRIPVLLEAYDAVADLFRG